MSKWVAKRYISKAIESNCYLVTNGKYSLVIDPSVSYDEIKKDIKGKLVAILITHGHFDHFYEIKSYLNIPDILFYLHENAIKKLENGLINYSRIYGLRYEIKTDERFITVKDGTLKIFDDLEIEVFEKPGHSDCSICFLFDDLLFTGDFLFKNSIGRCDLQTGNSTQMMLSLNSLKEEKRLKKYFDYVIYPGHDDITTLSEEFKYNPYLK